MGITTKLVIFEGDVSWLLLLNFIFCSGFCESCWLSLLYFYLTPLFSVEWAQSLGEMQAVCDIALLWDPGIEDLSFYP